MTQKSRRRLIFLIIEKYRGVIPFMKTESEAEMDWTCCRCGEIKNAYGIFVVKPLWKKPFGRDFR
jgi:hypothetical protein